MRKNKIFTLSLSLALIIGLFTGCSGSAENVNSDTEAEVPAITGQVTAIDGNNITLSLFTGRGMQNGGGRPERDKSEDGRQQNGRPEGSRKEDGTHEGGRPNITDDTADEIIPDAVPDTPSSEAVADANTDETVEKVITISDDTQINIADGNSTKTGSLDDITAGCMLSITYTKDDAGNEVISSVTVRNFSGGPRGQGREDKNQSIDSLAATDDAAN